MLSRRMLRIKAFKILFGRMVTGFDAVAAAEKELKISCEKSLDLYAFILRLMVELKKAAEERIEKGLQKFQPTPEEANPNYKFVNNRFISILDSDQKFLKFLRQRGLSWNEYQTFIKKLYLDIASQDYFIEYMKSPLNSIDEDKNLIKKILEQELEDNEDLEEILEDLSLYWIDDLGYVLGAIIKNLNYMASNEAVLLPAIFQNEDDELFATKLLTGSMVKYEEYSKLISKYVPHWDLDRLVPSDLLLIVMGTTEAVLFESIPLKVTINEYVDIAKFYSTPNSRVFVNGLLDKMIQKFQKDGIIVKKGRGLVGSNE